MFKISKEQEEWVELTWGKVNEKLLRLAVKSRDKLPYTVVNGVHSDNSETAVYKWTNGFWPGMMWLMYRQTGNNTYRLTAENAEKLLNRAFYQFDKLHHDVGFMWKLSSGANYRLTGNLESRNTTLLAAAMLTSRYNIDGGYIRAWNGTEEQRGRSIIDCMMNIPLLYWASSEIGDPRFAKIAKRHAEMTLRDHIRPDGSVNHIVDHDPETGEMIGAYAGQGYSETSCWSRGQAWAIYGCILSYIYTQDKNFLYAAIKTANYFTANVIQYQYLAPVDFRAPLYPQYMDSTAGLCAACGMLELAKYVSEAESGTYVNTAIQILKATDTAFCDYGENDYLVGMGTERYPHNSMNGVHIPIIYGDFFLVEALLKLKGSEFLIW